MHRLREGVALPKFISFGTNAAGMAPNAPPTAPGVPNGALAASRGQGMAAGALKTKAYAHVCGVRGSGASRDAPFP